MLKKIFLIVTILIATLILFHKKSQAQPPSPGYYTCFWNEKTDPPTCTLYPTNSCAEGFTAGDCSLLSPADCGVSSEHPCIPGNSVCGLVEGQTCCPGFACGTHLYCDMNSLTCKTCGIIGNKCCIPGPPDKYCREGAECNLSTNICEEIVLEPDESLHCQNNEINTAIGCISISDIDEFISQILIWSLGIAGGIFLILTIYSGLLIMTSQGDPRKYKLGNEILLSAVSGLIMLVFSIFLLRFLGVDILKIL